MTQFLSRLEGPAHAALRIVAGAMWSFHGMQKILGVLSTFKPAPFSQLWIGGVIEMVFGLLIVVGLFSRVAAFIASGEMAVAYFQFHFKLDFGAFRWLPAVNQGELAALYCFVFLYLAARGPGPASLDRMRGKG
jgi:putative oxidoreductase